jgi:hypothetical protein
MPADPTDAVVEKAIKKERKWRDPYLNSIDPPGFEGTGLGKDNEELAEFEKEEEKEDPEGQIRDTFEDLSSDKEKDTTEGEITDTEGYE